MGQTAENVAEWEKISRAEMDEFALRSQELAVKAQADGFFEREIIAVTRPDGSIVAKDDGPRADTTLEKLSSLAPGLPRGRNGDRGQRLPAQRRRRGGGRDERRAGPGAGHHAPGAHRRRPA